MTGKRYTFRIKPGSRLAEGLDVALVDFADGSTKSAMHDHPAELHWHIIDAIHVLGECADNFTFSRGGASYTEVIPQNVTVEHTDQVVGAPKASEETPGQRIVWPDVPFIGSTEDYPWFRKPSWYDRMEAMVVAGKNISVAGPPGIGKSSAIEYMAAEYGIPLVNISADSGLRRRDLTGNVELVNSHTQFMVAQYLAAVKNGWWVKIDEVNSAEPDALMYLNSQIAPPYSASFYGTTIKRHPDFRLFVTYNPGLVGTKPLPESFKDRFFPIKLSFPSEYQLKLMLLSNGAPEVPQLDWVVKFGAAVWEGHEKGRYRYQITPRRLMDALDLVKLTNCDIWEALDASVLAMIDKTVETRAVGDVLARVKQEAEFGRI